MNKKDLFMGRDLVDCLAMGSEKDVLFFCKVDAGYIPDFFLELGAVFLSRRMTLLHGICL